MKINFPGPRNTVNKGLEGEGKMESHGEEVSSQMQLPQGVIASGAEESLSTGVRGAGCSK